MCGLFGFVGSAPEDCLEQAVRSLSHRGPDAWGSYTDAAHGVFLGHTRLSIIDLSERALQPLPNETGEVQIVFNGEIYNFAALRAELVGLGHVFRSRSDTEVIVHAWEEWGRACVDRLCGMFAFVIWDRLQRIVFAARDRVGIKPLYIWRRGTQMAFASEPRAFLRLPGFDRGVNPEALARYLAHGYIPGRDSIWNGVERLPPGQWLTYEVETGRIERGVYWRPSERMRQISASVAAGELQDLLAQVVREHLVADVGVGVMLSGGLDSSAIAAHAAAAHPGMQAFSIGIRDWARSEADDAAVVARHLGLPQDVHTVGTSDFLGIEDTLGLIDEPLADTAVFMTEALCKLAKRNVKVALSGDGGDETFGGYQWYRELEHQPVRRHAAFAAETLRRMLGLGRPWPEGCANRSEYHRLIMSPSVRLEQLEGLFPALSAGQCDHAAAGIFREGFRPDAGRYRRWQLLDMSTYLVDNNLTRMDRISMAYGLEVRVPLLDQRIVEFALELPERLRIDGSELKATLRRSARDLLPAETFLKPKQGFSCPVQKFWDADKMAAHLSEGTMVQAGFVRAEPLRKLLDAPRVGGWQRAVWVLAVLESWHRRWVVEAAPLAPLPAVPARANPFNAALQRHISVS